MAFMAINASIKYQFEFLQSQWLHNGEFAGLARGDVDPFAGEPRDGSRFRIPSAERGGRRTSSTCRASSRCAAAAISSSRV